MPPGPCAQDVTLAVECLRRMDPKRGRRPRTTPLWGPRPATGVGWNGDPMSGITAKSFNRPDEQRTPPSSTVDVVHLAGLDVARITFQPGWRWSEHLASVAASTTCRLRHVGAVQSGVLHVAHSDGTEADMAAGDAYVIEPDHDAWVVGDEPVVVVEFESAAHYGHHPTAGIDVRGVWEND